MDRVGIKTPNGGNSLSDGGYGPHRQAAIQRLDGESRELCARLAACNGNSKKMGLTHAEFVRITKLIGDITAMKLNQNVQIKQWCSQAEGTLREIWETYVHIRSS